VKRHVDNEGFTLIELLISLALLSLMAIYAIQAFGAMRNMNRLEAAIEAQMEVDAVAHLLRSELGDARAVFQPSETQNAKLYFSGKSESLTFVSASNGERETGGLYVVTLRLDASGTLTSKRQLLGSKLNDHVNEVVLLRGVSKLNVTYAPSTSPNDTMDSWQTDNQLPIAIGVNIQFQKDDKRHWTDMLVLLQTAS
jgi:general secretion pathway protein J